VPPVPLVLDPLVQTRYDATVCCGKMSRVKSSARLPSWASTSLWTNVRLPPGTTWDACHPAT